MSSVSIKDKILFEAIEKLKENKIEDYIERKISDNSLSKNTQEKLFTLHQEAMEEVKKLKDKPH